MVLLVLSRGDAPAPGAAANTGVILLTKVADGVYPISHDLSMSLFKLIVLILGISCCAFSVFFLSQPIGMPLAKLQRSMYAVGKGSLCLVSS
jgi:hypothetical protein